MNIDFLRKTFSSLRHRNFRLFFAGQTVSLVGTWMQQTALAWLIYDMTGSKFLLGSVAAVGALPVFFLSIFGGVIADRFNKRDVIVLTQTISMIIVAVLAVLVWFKLFQIWHIFVISLFLGITLAVDMPARQAFLVEITGRESLMNAIALNSSIVNLARVIGPALAGVIMVQYGVSWCFILNALSFFAVIVALLNIKTPPLEIEQRTESVWEYTVSGIRYVKSNTMIYYLMILMALMGVFGWSYAILLPAFAKDVFSQGESGYSLLMSANGFGAFVGALFVAYLGNSKKKQLVMNIGIYFLSLMIFLLSICKIFWLSLVLISGAGMGLIVYFSSSTTLIQSNIEDSMRGRVMGIWALLFGGMMPVGNLYAGVVSQHFGVPFTMFLSSVICPVFTFILAFMYKQSTKTQL